MNGRPLTQLFEESPFEGYAYGYPHKTAYRPLAPPRPLVTLWENESSTRFFYLHLPFCEMRCGFCNLFTTTGAEATWVDDYISAVVRQMNVCRGFASAEQFGKGAIGGGTPTYLSLEQLKKLFSGIRGSLGDFPARMTLSVETSPGTVSEDKLRCLRENGVTRISMGVQSFLPEETRALGRPQDPAETRRAIRLLEAAGFAVLNLDLIYGIPNQTLESWRSCLDEATRAGANEIYLYPLYVRPLTGLDKLHRQPQDRRLDYYRMGRDFLLEQGFRQISMRLFRRPGVPDQGLDYCCQEDGMMGFGAGARSYTSELHYSTEYAVGRNGIRNIIQSFVESSEKEFAVASYGCELNPEEQRRRYVIKSLLRVEGLEVNRYRKRFGSEPMVDLPQLTQLRDESFLLERETHLQLTPAGLQYSDAIGPWLFSPWAKARMREFELI